MSITAREISNYDDIIDSRDVIARIEELESLHESADAGEEGAEWTDEDATELNALRGLAEEGANSADDWQYGAALIRESHFTAYAQELADDIGAIDRNAAWPLNHIDWEAAANELKIDYSEIDFDGVTYYVR